MELLKSKRFRDSFFQYSFVGGLVLIVVTFVVVGKTNLDAQGITSGFDFLWRSTGWDISFSVLDYSVNDPYWRVLMIGVLNTLLLGSISLVIATFIGILIGVMRTLDNKLARLVGTSYVETFRNIPLLLQLLFWYAILTELPKPKEAIDLLGTAYVSGRGIYVPALNIDATFVFFAIVAAVVASGFAWWIRSARRFSALPIQQRKRWSQMVTLGGLMVALAFMVFGRLPETELLSLPYLKGLNFRDGLRISPELLACIVTISIYGGAYIAEIVRSGFNAISKGQYEAGYALGLSQWQIFKEIRFPLALRIVMPTMINQYVWLLKATTIGIAIGFTDFFMIVSTSINQSGQTLELIGILMGGFLLINYSLAWVLNRVNDAIKLQGTQLRI